MLTRVVRLIAFVIAFIREKLNWLQVHVFLMEGDRLHAVPVNMLPTSRLVLFFEFKSQKALDAQG